MSKTVAIICELNPAHNGHKYIFEEAKRLTGADYLIAIMSGDFVQRGEPAIYDKHVRTKMALSIGADAVFELPLIFATASAQYFARGAVAIAKNLHCDYLAFGTESGDIKVIMNEDFNESNDILAREYLIAIDKLAPNIKPVLIKRQGAKYNDSNINNDGFSSASAIRNSLKANEDITNNIPDSIHSLIVKMGKRSAGLTFDDMSREIYYALLYNKDKLNEYFDVFDDLGEKIVKNINKYTTAEEFVMALKSKDIAYSHLKRALLHIVLRIDNSSVKHCIDNGYYIYTRLLGFRECSKELFNEFKKNQIKIISKLADAENILDSDALTVLDNDIKASNLYNYLMNSKYNSYGITDERTRPIVILK